MKRSDPDIRKVRKDGTTVILDAKHYISKANKQLQNNLFYQKLNEDPTKLTIDEVGTSQLYVKFINLIYMEDP